MLDVLTAVQDLLYAALPSLTPLFDNDRGRMPAQATTAEFTISSSH